MNRIIITAAVSAALVITLGGCAAAAPSAPIVAANDTAKLNDQIADLETALADAEYQAEQCALQSNAYREAGIAMSAATEDWLNELAANVFTPELVGDIDLTAAYAVLEEAKGYDCEGSY